MSHAASLQEAAVLDRPEPKATPKSPYLRRARAAQPRARGRLPLPLVLGVVVVTTLLFARVWQVTSAHALAMQKDSLKKEVAALDNRIRLSSDLAIQEALHQGLDYAALAKQGFQSPNPDAMVEVDLAQPYPRVVSRQGAMARLSADVGRLVRGILPARRGAPASPPDVPGQTSDDLRMLPVTAEVSR